MRKRSPLLLAERNVEHMGTPAPVVWAEEVLAKQRKGLGSGGALLLSEKVT